MKINVIVCLFVLFFQSPATAETSTEYIRQNAVSLEQDNYRHLIDFVRDKKVLLFGEGHGTNEMPDIFFQIVTRASIEKRLQVGLEFPKDIQGSIDQFMKSGDDNILKGLEFFTNSSAHSGRASFAMVKLLKDLRRFKNIEVFCFDIPTDYQNADRDTEMARNILSRIDEKPNQPIFVLTGNIHSRVTPGVPWDPEFKTMGSELIKLSAGKLNFQAVQSFIFRFDEGTSWECRRVENGEIACKDYYSKAWRRTYVNATAFSIYFLVEPKIQEGHQNSIYFKTKTASFPWRP